MKNPRRTGGAPKFERPAKKVVRYHVNDLDAWVTGFTPRALECMRQRGEGPRYSKVGKSIRYAVADLRAWMEAGHDDNS